MRGLLGALGIAACVVQGPAWAEAPVVVELFTSQGCSSCPPADQMVHELARRDDVIALGLHVDYWDYIGWADSFAQPAFTRRQKAYAAMAGDRMVYTPQFVIGGAARIVGAKPMKVMEAVMDRAEAPAAVELELDRLEDALHISARRLDGDDTPLVVQLVRYMPEARVAIERGENAGRELSYANIVTSWEVVARWKTGESMQAEVPLDGDQPGVVIVQQDGPGAILGAARLP